MNPAGAHPTDEERGGASAGLATGSRAKVRSRRDGSAVPLDETDKKLLNLMQGSFSLCERPFAHVAGLAGLSEDEVMERVQYLLDKRIIREVTPIFDTRALGYRSMLVAAKVDSEHPHRAAQFINSHPGVTHNYLRNHEFNLWFTLAVEPDSTLGLDGTLDVMAAKTGAESIRQLPTLKLFKIRMDLEMEGGTDALAKAGQAVEPLELDPIELSQDDVDVIRATQGPMAVRSDAYVPAAEKLGVPVAEVLSRLASLQERGGLRRVAAILYHRRAGFSANGMGVWAVPEDEILDTGRRMAAFRGISHCYQRPTYADWPYSVFTMAHGRSKEECDAILDSIAESCGIEERATLYSSTEFKKIRMLYFTEDFKRWEQEHSS
jgi:DNA-binding Lrp family transcriptional regulator